MQWQDAPSKARVSGWLRVAATMVMALVLRRIVRRRNLGVVGAAAVPLVVGKLSRKR